MPQEILSSWCYSKEEELAIWQSQSDINPRQLLFWSWYEPRNFGDWIGPYLFEAITGLKPIFCPRNRMDAMGCIMSVGSTLRHLIVDDQVTVWGTGIISSDDVFKRPKKVHAVRGPLTKHRLESLGYECPAIFGDPAILLPKFYQPVQSLKRHSIGLIPHFVDLERLGFAEGLHTIDPTRPVPEVIDDISSCEMTFSSSLHGLIVSHAYGVPCIWIRSINPIHGDDSKFRDYFLSVGLDPEPVAVEEYTIQNLAMHKHNVTMPDHNPLLRALEECCPFSI